MWQESWMCNSKTEVKAMIKYIFLILIGILSSLVAYGQIISPPTGSAGLNDLGTARIYTPFQYDAKGDFVRASCTVTTSGTSLTISGCSSIDFTGRAGQYLVVNNAGASSTTPLATTIASVTSATQVVMADAAGQTLSGASEYISVSSDDATAAASGNLQYAAMQTTTPIPTIDTTSAITFVLKTKWSNTTGSPSITWSNARTEWTR